MLRQNPPKVDILVLGAGWTSQFLLPQLTSQNIKHAATTTTGRNDTIPFRFDAESEDVEAYKRLPEANTVLITFPLLGHGQSKHITSLYRSVHGAKNAWIQLGSTGIYNKSPEWNTEDSDYDRSDKRGIAEDELRTVVGGCVLCLAGLYGGERIPRTWLPRLAKTKEDVRKRKAVHFVHGEDVARAIIAVHGHFTPGKRWIVADLRVYDWYDLIMSFAALTEEEEESMRKGEMKEGVEMKVEFAKWVGELMVEEEVRALPRSVEVLGRKLDSRGFWREMGVWPRHARLA
ncbi:hypothetical protein P154DRAFT_190377 [Amniculicola lignicola CBS 123094]|uniref:NAD(P)-binding protein n=1 Tax=Amniculicola lignicola CBS 123094 TaxID=1392246 RepID=A0A6A5WIU6_9PLEO|nr:hypothetical protein P154DRAFT_190377 [Amniculicola lignicola CBS 123094]